MLAPSAEPARGNGRCSHPCKTVSTARCHHAGPVGTHHWYTTNPAAHAAAAVHRTPSTAGGGRRRTISSWATNTPNSGTNTDPSRNRNASNRPRASLGRRPSQTASPTPAPDTARIVGTRPSREPRFWLETAAEYTSANASSVSPTSSARSTTHPPAREATASPAPAGLESGRAADSASSAPSAYSHAFPAAYPTNVPIAAARGRRANRA